MINLMVVLVPKIKRNFINLKCSWMLKAKSLKVSKCLNRIDPWKKKIKASDKINKINNLSSIDNMINKLEDEAKQKEQKLSETLPAIN